METLKTTSRLLKADNYQQGKLRGKYKNKPLRLNLGTTHMVYKCYFDKFKQLYASGKTRICQQRLCIKWSKIAKSLKPRQHLQKDAGIEANIEVYVPKKHVSEVCSFSWSCTFRLLLYHNILLIRFIGFHSSGFDRNISGCV